MGTYSFFFKAKLEDFKAKEFWRLYQKDLSPFPKAFSNYLGRVPKAAFKPKGLQHPNRSLDFPFWDNFPNVFS